MKLILIRHGETIENKNEIIQGQRIGTLTKLGIEQAKKLANKLRNEKIDYIYSSDLKRAKDTAKEIAKYHPKTPIKFVEELRERKLGSFEGKKISEIDWSKSYTDVETEEQMQKRIKKFLDRVYLNHKNDTILFVGHNGINKALITVILHEPTSRMKEYEQKNATINIFDIKENKKHVIYLLDCIKHLG